MITELEQLIAPLIDYRSLPGDPLTLVQNIAERVRLDSDVVLRELGYERVGSRCDDGSLSTHVGTINGHNRPVYGKPV